MLGWSSWTSWAQPDGKPYRLGFSWEMQLDVIDVAVKRNIMDYAAVWECEEEDELVMENAEW